MVQRRPDQLTYWQLYYEAMCRRIPEEADRIRDLADLCVTILEEYDAATHRDWHTRWPELAGRAAHLRQAANALLDTISRELRVDH